jgi:8-oxo-dGTP diphosphatase
VIEAQPWVVQTFTYPHATVRLNFFKVTAWQGEPQPHEGQAFVWQTPGATTADPILPANTPILRGLQLPPVLAFSNVAEMGEGAWLDALSRRLEQGMRWVVLREPQMEPQAYRALAAKVLAQCRAHGAHLLLHDAVESVQAIGADGVHLPARRLMQTQMRPDGWCGASVHNMEELTHACALGLDYAVLGSVKASKTHPGGAVLGWESVGQILAAGSSIPVYGIGGLSTDDLDDAIALGAQGVAMIRAAWI